MLRESDEKRGKLIKMFRHVPSTRESKQKDLTINDVKMLKCDSFTNAGRHFRQGLTCASL
jgi:glycerol-3-phosphate cytidylyltransferase-like family protein